MASKTLWSSDDYIEYSPLFPNPVRCVKDMAVTGMEELYLRLPWNGLGAWLTETKDWIIASAYIDTGVIFYPVLFAVLFTILREILNRALFKVGNSLATFIHERGKGIIISMHDLFQCLMQHLNTVYVYVVCAKPHSCRSSTWLVWSQTLPLWSRTPGWSECVVVENNGLRYRLLQYSAAG